MINKKRPQSTFLEIFPFNPRLFTITYYNPETFWSLISVGKQMYAENCVNARNALNQHALCFLQSCIQSAKELKNRHHY